MSSYVKVVLKNETNFDEWKHFVNDCPSATFYHLPEWGKIIEESFGYKSFNIFAKNEHGNICGMLPLSHVKSPLTGNRLVSLPFSYLCGPISTPNCSIMPLLDEAKKLSKMLKCDYLEIRTKDDDNTHSNWSQSGFERAEQYSTFILDVLPLDITWKKLNFN